MDETAQAYGPTVPAARYAADVTQQDHYSKLSPQPRTVISKWGLGFMMGNAVKYIARAGRKGDYFKDIAKAGDYCLFHLMEHGQRGHLEALAEALRRYLDLTDGWVKCGVQSGARDGGVEL